MSARILLVTGGAGFIGANFVRHWLGRFAHDRIVVVDALTYAGNRANLADLDADPRFTFIHADICDGDRMAAVMADEGVDTVVHFAAESHVDRSIHGPAEFVRTNVVGTLTLLDAARGAWSGEHQGRLFHHVSTDEVYGSLGPDEAAFAETRRYEPNSPYAASKAGSDHLVRAYHHTYGLPVTTSNCSNNYGPFQFPEKLIPLMIVNLLRGEPLPVYGDGSNVRDWLHVEDHCTGIEQVMLGGRPGETYNIGGGNEWRNIELVELLCRLMDEAFAADAELADRFPDCLAARSVSCAESIRFVTDRPGHDRRYAIDGRKIADEIGHRPRIEFDRGLRDTLRWYLGHADWWRAVMDGSYRDWVAQHYRG